MGVLAVQKGRCRHIAKVFIGDVKIPEWSGNLDFAAAEGPILVCLPAPVDHFKETRSTSVLVSPHSRAKRRLLRITGRLSRAPGG